MTQGIKRQYDNVIYTHCKKHYCPTCNEKLSVIKCSKIVHSHSEEAKNFDFLNGDGFWMGNIKFIWDEFLCSHCNLQWTVKKMRQIEKDSRKKKDSLKKKTQEY